MTVQVGQDTVTVTSEGPQGPPGPAGPGAATDVSYDDAITQLGATNVQDAIVALWQLISAQQSGRLDFSNPNQSGLLGLGV